jgi:dUTP pyrophosphatase
MSDNPQLQHNAITVAFKRSGTHTLPLPKYSTEGSAAFDLAACLTRPTKLIRSDSSLTYVEPYHSRLFINNAASGVDTFGIRAGQIDLENFISQNPDPANGSLSLIIEPGDTITVSLGFHVDFPQGFVLLLAVRSSMSKKGISLANNVGIIDSDYRGELLAALRNDTKERIKIEHGERIVQGLLVPVVQAKIVETDNLSETARGEGGFGSTGKM